VLILIIFYFFDHINIFSNKEQFESEQEINQDKELQESKESPKLDEVNEETENSSGDDNASFNLYIYISIVLIILLCLVAYGLDQNMSISDQVQKKQMEHLNPMNLMETSKPYIIIVQPSILPVGTNPIYSPNPMYLQNQIHY
jgi:uncharacterized membrane protein